MRNSGHIFPAAILVCIASQSANAQQIAIENTEDRELVVAAAVADDQQALDDAAERPLVQIGFHTVSGEPRYARRSESIEGPAVVHFSATRPRPSLEGIDLPDGMPVRNSRVTSGFGYRIHPISRQMRRHSGVDLAAPRGTPVYTTADGTVRSAGWAGNYGLLVVIDHGDGVQTRYAHLSATSVARGDTVSQGELLGRSGSTGRSTGPHLHYEVRVNGQAIDPLD